jgi:hypothetical protein
MLARGRRRDVHRSQIRRRQQVGTVMTIVCLSVAGCGGGDNEPGSTPSGGGSSASSDACAGLARFSATLDSTVNAISNGGDVHEVQGSVAGLKDEYISILGTLQDEAPQAADDLSTAMQGLQDAVARLPREAAPDRVSASLKPHVTAVETSVDDTEAQLDCPPS